MNGKIHEEEKSSLTLKKTGQSQSLKKIKEKVRYEQFEDKGKGFEKKIKEKHKSYRVLRAAKFDTPEKKQSPKPRRELIKSPLNMMENRIATPFPANFDVFPKKKIQDLIGKGKITRKKCNPMLLTPVLNRRKDKENNKCINALRFHTPGEGKIAEVDTAPSFSLFSVERTPETHEKPPAFEIPDQIPSIQSKIPQPSFGNDSEDRCFLSERLSNECESNQSLKYTMEKPELFKGLFGENSDFFESLQSSSLYEAEKFNIETQTEEFGLEGALKDFNDKDIKMGIKFISQIAQFIKHLK